MGVPVFSESYFEGLRRLQAELDAKERAMSQLDDIEAEAVMKRIARAVTAVADRKKSNDEGSAS